MNEAQSFHLRQDTGGGEHSGVPATSPRPACSRPIIDLSNSWPSYHNPPSELPPETLDLCAQNPKSTGQEGTALTRCTARRTAISSESSIADSHPHSRGARLRAPITDLRSRASLCTVL
ncbi:hypothetical protein Bca52824_078332 [Brassica carinata]|uniref:Uncharacterized protein n=1 Tax=Brassica carinata TaxID=52824 RepID=A0A8X7PYW4_BRACI|nr:hypothetical protein Bca52824_078332 [Brassica carinata]